MVEQPTRRLSRDFYFSALLFFGAAVVAFFLAWQEMNVQRTLAMDGAVTEGVIVICRDNVNIGGATIQFTPPDASQMYEVAVPALEDCQEGRSLMMRYLPSDPSVALPVDHTSVPLTVMLGLMMIVIGLFAMAHEWRKSHRGQEQP